MATRSKSAGERIRPGFVLRDTYRAPGTNVRNQHHPVTAIHGRRFPKSYREYA